MSALKASTASAADTKRVVIYQAEDAIFAPATLEVVEQTTFDGKKGVAFKAGITPKATADLNAPDLIFKVNEPQAGRFYLRTAAAVDEAGAELMRKAPSKHDSLFAQIQIGKERPTRRVVFVPWSAPEFCYYSVDLTAAYTKKVKSFVRTFCFMNLGRPSTPAAILVFDDITTADPNFKKYFQLNTLCPPMATPDGMSFHNSAFGVTGRLDVCMLWPKPGERTIDVKSNADVHNVFGFQCTPPSPKLPESNGHRVLFSPTTARQQDRFLTLLRLCDDTTAPLPYELSATPVSAVLRIADRIVSLAKDVTLISEPFEITVPVDGQAYKVLLAGMSAGAWTITPTSGEAAIPAVSEAGKNTLYFVSKGGVYQVAPVPRGQ